MLFPGAILVTAEIQEKFMVSPRRPSCLLSESSSYSLQKLWLPSLSMEVIIAINDHHVPGILDTISFISREVCGSTVKPLWLIHRVTSSIGRGFRDGPGLAQHPPSTDEELEVQRGKASCRKSHSYLVALHSLSGWPWEKYIDAFCNDPTDVPDFLLQPGSWPRMIEIW